MYIDAIFGELVRSAQYSSSSPHLCSSPQSRSVPAAASLRGLGPSNCAVLGRGDRHSVIVLQTIDYAWWPLYPLTSFLMSVNFLCNYRVSQKKVGSQKITVFHEFTQPRMHQFWKSLCPSSRGGPEVSETPPTWKVWMILGQVIAI